MAKITPRRGRSRAASGQRLGDGIHWNVMGGSRKGGAFLDEVVHPGGASGKIDMVRLHIGGDGVACFPAAFRL